MLLVSLELLEDAVQTACRHLFCKECIVALCEAKGADANCPQCRAGVTPASLLAPLVPISEEEKARKEREEEQRRELDEQEAKAKAEGEDAMRDIDDAAPAAAAAAAAPAASGSVKVKAPPKKRARLSAAADERKEADDDDEDAEEEEAVQDGAGAGEESKEINPDDLSGSIEFDAKLLAIVAEVRRMKEADPTAKALIFTQFRGTMERIDKKMNDEDIKHEMVQTHNTQAATHSGTMMQPHTHPCVCCVCACPVVGPLYAPSA